MRKMAAKSLEFSSILGSPRSVLCLQIGSIRVFTTVQELVTKHGSIKTFCSRSTQAVLSGIDKYVYERGRIAKIGLIRDK